MSTALFDSNLTRLPLLHSGKVRDLYTLDEQHLLMVATDRISAFDVILPTPIPDKGKVLTTISNFWFDFIRDLIPTHLTSLSVTDVLTDEVEQQRVTGRAVVVRKLQPLPVEAIVRGYIAGSGWKSYQRTGAISGITLPKGLLQADQLAEPIFTPSSKASVGKHDENIDFAQMIGLVGEAYAEQIRDVSLAIYKRARDYAAEQAMIIADTKFEFGVDAQGQLVLMDEVLTPDSSRFWDASTYQVGISPPNFDKQFVRDYLETLTWNKTAPGPELPAEIVEKTRAKYQEAQTRLLGH